MNIPRLKRMIAVLEEVEAKHAGHFDMDTWVWTKGFISDADAFMAVQAHACGSSACAVGWYCIANPDVGMIWKSPHSFDNIGEHFGITGDEALRLFDPEKYDAEYAISDGEEAIVTPRHVINRIREMIGEGV